MCGEFELPQMCGHLFLIVLQPAQLWNRVTSVDLLRRILERGMKRLEAALCLFQPDIPRNLCHVLKCLELPWSCATFYLLTNLPSQRPSQVLELEQLSMLYFLFLGRVKSVSGLTHEGGNAHSVNFLEWQPKPPPPLRRQEYESTAGHLVSRLHF